MKLTIAILLLSTVSVFAQKYEYTQMTTIESVIPGGIGRSRMITTKPNGELDEVKMENFFSIVGINFGNVRRYKDASAMFRLVARPLGFDKGEGMHQLRHTCASVLIKLGNNAKQIQEWLGHESILETMDTYGHLFPRDLHEVCERLDAYVVEQMEITAERKMLA